MNPLRRRYRCGTRLVRRAAPALAALLLVSACSADVRMFGGNGAAASPGAGMNGAGMNGAGMNGAGMNGAGMNGAGGGRHATSPCSTPSSTATTVRVVLADMGRATGMGDRAPMGAHMMLRSLTRTVAPGRITFVALNRGWRTHELVILPLAGSAAGQRAVRADGTVSEAGALGEASSACGAGAGNGIPAGSASWVTVTLAAGRYELVCNLPNHYADGMHQEFDVG